MPTALRSNPINAFICGIAAMGLLVFGSSFVISWVQPGWVESVAKELIRIEVQHRVGERIDALDGGKLAAIAKRLSREQAAEAAELKRRLAEGLPQKVAAIAAQMRQLDCPCRKAIESSLGGILEAKAAGLLRMNERLELLIRSKYMAVAESLTREFRIVTGANALVFALLLGGSLLRKTAGVQLLLPTLVLLGAAGAVAGLYLFNQDWLHTLVFSDFLGFGYFVYLSLAIALLMDVLLNRARLITRMLNAVAAVLGVATLALPC